MSKPRALAATLRLPNLPSVWSNTLTGSILACLMFGTRHLGNACPALLAATCLYLAGNLLNDWIDREWDSRHRPERALPRGLFLPAHYLTAAVALVIIGLCAAALAGLPALGIAIGLTLCIVIYSWTHKRTAWSAIPMACCRGLLPLLGYWACSQELAILRLKWAVLPAALLFVYLIMLTLRARSESRGQTSIGHSSATAAGLLLPPLMLGVSWYFPHHWSEVLPICLAASAPYLVWTLMVLTIHRRPVSRQVSAMLAGIPLVDGLFLLPYFIMGHWLSPHDPLSLAICFAWLAAFLLGRLLQRYVPAT